MKTIEVKIPDTVLDQAHEIALSEGAPLEQILSLAITQALSNWNSESALVLRHKRADREKFLDAINGMLELQAARTQQVSTGDGQPS